MRDFAARLAGGRPLILDGGLATELETRGFDLNHTLWSASVLRSDPDAIQAAHRAYLDAGAGIIISASYQASRQSFGGAGLGPAAADELILASIRLACAARDEFLADNPDMKDPPLVAASVGPYGAALHDGSEYRGDYAIGRDGLRGFHADRIALLETSEADLLACETIPSAAEAEVLAELLDGCSKPAWLSFSCRDGRRISDGSALADVARGLRQHPAILALGVNCTPPQFITSLIGELRRAAPDKAIVVYPNSGETYHVEDNSWSGTVTAADWRRAAQQWAAAGANVIGGCCRTGPGQVRAISESL